MGSLYVIGAPAGHHRDLTRRALRILREVALIVAQDAGAVQGLLAQHDIETPLLAAEVDAVLNAMIEGDVAYLCPGWSAGLDALGRSLIGAAISYSYTVVPVPGPTLPLTALVISGFPADSFIHLGELPQQNSARLALLDSVASARRTIVVEVLPSQLVTVLTDLHIALGDRPMVLVVASEQGTEVIWRGTLGEVDAPPGPEGLWRGCALVIAGMHEPPSRWAEEHLRAEIERWRSQGLGTKEISQALAAESGWLRREIYRLVVQMDRIHKGKGEGA